MRKKYVIGNWKMNKTLDEGLSFIKELKQLIQGKNLAANMIIASPFIHLFPMYEKTKETDIMVAAQNCSDRTKGAFTGEISAEMVLSTGTKYVILGHSERRNYYNETDILLCNKVITALASNLSPIFCIGESLNQRELKSHFNIIEQQLHVGLFHLTKDTFMQVIIAYEPVWAIGTGVTASPEQSQEMHAHIRKLIANKYDGETAKNTSILYGGSCKPSNAKEIFANEDIDGGLIGGASLNPTDFFAIVNAF